MSFQDADSSTKRKSVMKKDAQYFETMIIGTGFSGLLAAIRLKKNNLNDFVLLERGSDIGGTWRDNSYPGAEVDIPTGLYSISFIPYKFKKDIPRKANCSNTRTMSSINLI